jgi:WD40 repeat protein
MKLCKNSVTILGMLLVYGTGYAMDDEQPAQTMPTRVTVKLKPEERLALQKEMAVESKKMQEYLAGSQVPSLQELTLNFIAKEKFQEEYQEKIAAVNADTIEQTRDSIKSISNNFEGLYIRSDTSYISLFYNYLAKCLGNYYPINNVCMKSCTIKASTLMYGRYNTSQVGAAKPILITVDASKESDGYITDIVFWDAMYLKPLAYLRFSGTYIEIVAVNAEGTRLAMGSKNGEIHLWDISAFQNNELKLENLKELGRFAGHPNACVEKLMFIKDKNGNNFVLSAASDKTVKIWDPSLKMVQQAQQLNMQCIATVGDNNFLSKVTIASIKTWYWIPEFSVLVVGRSNGDIELLHIVSFNNPANNTIKLEPSIFATVTGHNAAVTALKVSPDNSMLISGASDGCIKIWDMSKIASISCIATFKGHEGSVQGLELLSGGTILASASSDKTVKKWHITNPVNPHLINTLIGHGSPIKGLLCSHDNLVSISDDTVTVWQEATTNYTLCVRALEKVVASRWWRDLFNKRLDLSNLKRLIATLSDAEQRGLALQYDIDKL